MKEPLTFVIEGSEREAGSALGLDGRCQPLRAHPPDDWCLHWGLYGPVRGDRWA